MDTTINRFEKFNPILKRLKMKTKKYPLPKYMLLNIAMIALFVCVLLIVNIAHARPATLNFSWTPQPEVVAEQEITELRVYQDSSDNAPAVEDPNAGKITIDADITGCSYFWATYYAPGDESDRTDPPIKVCAPGLDDPEPATRVISVGGFKLTIDFEPLP